MNLQYVARRMVLALVVVALALPVLRADANVLGPFSYDSRAHFESICRKLGGTITDMGDNVWCQLRDGSQTVCDANGKDCYYIWVLRGSPGSVGPIPGSGGIATTNGGDTTPTAPIAQLPQTGTVRATASRDEGQRHEGNHSPTANGKHGRHHHRGGQHQTR
jgi:hypothetical protein